MIFTCGSFSASTNVINSLCRAFELKKKTMSTHGTEAIEFKSVVRIDLQGHFQGQKAKNLTS